MFLGWNQDLEELEIAILENTKKEMPKFIKFSIKYLTIPMCGVLFLMSFATLVKKIKKKKIFLKKKKIFKKIKNKIILSDYKKCGIKLWNSFDRLVFLPISVRHSILHIL